MCKHPSLVESCGLIPCFQLSTERSMLLNGVLRGLHFKLVCSDFMRYFVLGQAKGKSKQDPNDLCLLVFCGNLASQQYSDQSDLELHLYCSVALVNLHRKPGFFVLVHLVLCLSPPLTVQHSSLGQGLPFLNTRKPPCHLGFAITENHIYFFFKFSNIFPFHSDNQRALWQ